MRHFKTPAGEVHSLRFAPDGGSIYLLSKEPYHSFADAGDLGGLSGLPGFSDLAGIVSGLLPMSDLSRLYQHAYRIDIRSGEITGEWSFSGSEVAIFTPDLRSIYHSVSVAVAGGELDLRRLDLATGNEMQVYEANVPYPHGLAFTPNGHILAIRGQHYAGDGRECVHRLDVWHRTEIDPIPFETDCLAYSPDGRVLATGHRMNGVRLWQGKTLAWRRDEPASVLAWSSDGQLAWGAKERLAVARPDAGAPERTWNAEGIGYLWTLAFSPDNQRLLIGGYRGLCALHDVIGGRPCEMFDWGIGMIHSVCFAPDGLTCAAGGEKGQVVVWDVDG